MAPTEEELKYRAAELRDILSSFDAHELPIEFQEPIFKNITGRRPPRLRLQQTDWTIPGNLQGTLLQWGAYNDQGWSFLSEIQSADSRAIAFSEKLHRRFEDCFDEYDELVKASLTAAVAKERLYQISQKLNILAAAIYEDRQRRELREVDTLKVALRALATVCDRTEVIVPTGAPEPSRRSRRTASLGDASLSLFAAVIRQPSSTSHPFLLEALELFSGAALKACLTELISVNGQLNHNAAGDAYIQRFEALQQKANDESLSAAPNTPGAGPSTDAAAYAPAGHNRGLEADPKPGSKRPHPMVDTPPKRGKRATGK